MTRQDFPKKWNIAASSSPVFPPGSRLRLEPGASSSRFDLLLEEDGKPSKKLFDQELPEVTFPGAAPSLRGDFDDQDRPFLLIATLCPGRDDKAPKLLCGQVHFRSGGIDPGGTGVWVAEEQPPKEDEEPDGGT